MANRNWPKKYCRLKNWSVLVFFLYTFSFAIQYSHAEGKSLNSTQTLHPSCKEENLECNSLPQVCVQCKFNYSCSYGEEIMTNCAVKPEVKCLGNRSFDKNLKCMFCYQTPKYLHECKITKICKVAVSPQQRMTVNCTVDESIYCMGTRSFRKSLSCNWSSGCRWSTTMLLSVSLGGFGIDRFYLGHWKEGFGKIFSFGGLGVWTLVDIVLIAVGYYIIFAVIQ